MLNCELIEDTVGYRFRDHQLLITAFTHSTYANVYGAAECYDRMEYLGDSVLSLVVADYLYRSSGDERDEGQLSRARSIAVDQAALTRVMDDWGLSSRIMTAGVNPSQGKIPSDVVESLIGAVYLDGGYDVAKKFVLTHIKYNLDQILKEGKLESDIKTKLQEAVQRILRNSKNEIVYLSNPENSRISVTVQVAGHSIGTGYGATKKEAERSAATASLKLLTENPSIIND